MPEPVKLNRIPQLLKSRPQWVVWRYEERDGKRTKPPFTVSGRNASHSDPSTWTTFEAVRTAYQKGGWNGIGYMLADDDPVAGVDLDHCVGEDGELADWAARIVDRLDSYTEISPSGTGLRVFVEGSLPPQAPKGGRKINGQGPDKAGAVEMYQRLRYLTVTGKKVKGAPADLAPRTEELQGLYAEIFPEERQKPHSEKSTANTGETISLSDSELLAKMFQGRNGSAIIALWNGDTSAYNGDDSAADLALCNHLAWWTKGDEGRMDRLFRQSRLYREKWEREDYRQATLGIALADLPAGAGYEPGGAAAEFSLEEDPEDAQAREDALNTARELISTLPALLKESRGAIYRPEILEALSLLDAHDPGAFEEARGVCREMKIGLRRLDEELRKLAKSKPAPDDPGLAIRAGDQLPNCPMPELLIPHPYRLTPGSVSKASTSDEGKEQLAAIAYAPLMIIGKLDAARQRTQHLLLSWKTSNRPWETRAIDREAVYSARKVGVLAKHGAPIGDHNVRDLIPYFAKLEATNEKAFPVALVTSHLGWQGADMDRGFLVGRTLILPDGEVVSATELDLERPETWDERTIAYHGLGDGDDQIVDAFHSAGSFEEWVKLVAHLEGHWKALLLFYAAFVPPLLEVLRVPNFVVDVAGPTSRGKTTLMRVVASAWGCPDERAPLSLVHTWDASRVFQERASAVISGCPLILDDTKRARRKEHVAEMLYSVCSGKGRGRGTTTGLAETPTYRTVLFSTGETPATSFTQDGGTRTRVVELHGPPFGAADAESGLLVAKLNAGLRQHFGHAAPRFLQWLMKERSQWDMWRDHYTRVVEMLSLSPPSPEAGRLAQYAAAISVAGQMVHEALSLPWTWDDPVPRLWADIAAEAAEASGAIRALDAVYSWACANEHTFHGRFHEIGTEERVPNTISGQWLRESWSEIAFYPTVLRKVLQAEGFDEAAILREWRDRGWIKCASGKFTYPVRLFGSSDQRKMTVINREALNEDAE